MKLVHPDLENQIVFLENTVNVLTIENKSFFTEFTSELFSQYLGNEGKFVLSEDNKELSVSKTCELILNPINIDINNKQNLNKIYSILKQSISDEYNYIKTCGIKSEILKYIDEIVFSLDIPLKRDDEFDLTSIFKAVNISFETEYKNLLEKIIDYISASVELNQIRCFIFINLKQFLNFKDLSELYKFARYIKTNLFLIEGSYISTKEDCEKSYIIDNDLCEIY
ncbi:MULTISPECIES: type II-A CRISPR-associated protein Csn2 [unclassified Treponema]|uniref:type II-A CRISPR-associated protein Csn2 n=1 Tax=unclassified Treponema TaxID=2638727 RepID=UPI0020A61CD2|nr:MULTISPECIES: type II-A CRISPR-associated protein Csn2 [unclassified Treponema]UTC66690.1 type II-A CRISPR-associated protein Csn2 [Treponema sp. OMZ 789]UTC69422.1 type II-A CRISPR-associated protein Csn2 [Treponema sp. OMZ 790]UTC72136.1 type II-A CRISPR-associated protein Csn2 [Treponema sp. OMZ 791]